MLHSRQIRQCIDSFFLFCILYIMSVNCSLGYWEFDLLSFLVHGDFECEVDITLTDMVTMIKFRP